LTRSTNATVVWLSAPGQIELRSEPLGTLGSQQVECETLVTVISPGTELAAYRGLPALRPGTGYPRLQGYCNVARVVAVGEAVTGLAPGDRILSFTSHRDRFLIDQDDVLLVLPNGADAGKIAVSYLFHLGYNAVLRADVRAGSRVLVIGLGALGLTSVAMAALAGASVEAVSAHAAAAARALGASRTLTRDDDVITPADVVILTTNSWDDWQLALRSAAPHATIAVLGFPGRGEPLPTVNPLDSQHFYVKQLRVEAVGLSPERPDSRGFLRFNERDNLAFIASRISAGVLDPTPIISGSYSGRDIQRAYDDLVSRRESPVTYLLDWQP
jgi:threonine dehydrogenase-like Zn-dependent dehydrogenase